MKISSTLFVLIAFVIVINTMEVLANTTTKVKLRPNELIEIIKLDSTIKLDIRYATKNNFLGRPVYTKAKAYLQKQVAEDLIKASKEINKFGYGLLIFDGYRPWSITKVFWDEIEPEKRKFVAEMSLLKK